MMMRLCAFAIFASGIFHPTPEIDRAFTSFESGIEKELAASHDRSHTQLRRHATEAYERLFGSRLRGGSLHELTSGDLDLILRAAEIAGTYAPEEGHARDMTAVLEELSRRGDATKVHYTATYRMLVAVRDLAAARRLAAQYPAGTFESLPVVRGEPGPAKGPNVWVPGHDPNQVVHRRVDVEPGPRIVVVSHPSCHFSRKAMSAIAADDVLGPLFRSHATWIAPQSGTLNLPVLHRWNREHRGFEVALAVRQSEWTFVDYWNTPTFYFLKDGAVVQKVIGWPKEGRRQELLAASRNAGMLQ